MFLFNWLIHFVHGWHRAFVNSVWYIKILSPEDVQQLGKHEVESFGQNPGEKIHRDLSEYPASIGSLDFWSRKSTIYRVLFTPFGYFSYDPSWYIIPLSMLKYTCGNNQVVEWMIQNLEHAWTPIFDYQLLTIVEV